MIVPSMTSAELYREILTDAETVNKKAWHLTNNLRREAVKSKDKRAYRIFNHVSPRKNQWNIFVEFNKVAPVWVIVVHYIDTFGFNAVMVGSDSRTLSHFTPHFLERYNERFLQEANFSKLDLLQRFISENPADMTNYASDSDKIFTRFREGIGLGGCERVSNTGIKLLHYRTFIS